MIKVITVGAKVVVKGVNRLHGIATVTSVHLPYFSIRWIDSKGTEFGGDYTYDELILMDE